MTFTYLFLINVFASFLLSWLLVKFGIKYKILYCRFTDSPVEYLEKIELDGTYKFQVEYFLSFAMVPMALALLAFLSYVLSRPLLGIENWEFLLMSFFGEFILITSAAMMIRATFEIIFQERELRHRYARDLYLTQEGFYLPIAPLEGVWREIARKSQKNFLYLKYSSISELQVLPVSGSYFRPKPAYYKIILTDSPFVIFIQRKQFYGREKYFLEKISSKINITIDDELKD